jgi:hypothetical protein
MAPAALLEHQAHREQQPVEGEVEQRALCGGGDEPAVGVDAWRQQRCPGGPFDPDEADEPGDGQHGGRDDRGTRPAQRWGFDEREDEPADQHGRGGHAAEVEAPVAACDGRHRAQAPEDGGDADDHVDGEHGAPVDECDERPAQQRPGRHPDASRGGPPADEPMPHVLVGGGGRGQDERAGQQKSGASALDQPGEVEHQHRPGGRADDGGHGEDDQARHEGPLRAEGVRDRAGAEHDRGEGQRVGVDGPFQLGTGGVQVCGELGKGEVHDRAVDEDHEGRDQREHHDTPPVFDTHRTSLGRVRRSSNTSSLEA